MDYEKTYKEALERAKAMIKVAANQDEAIGFANTIFPELKESEDERIRKELLEFLDELSKLGKNTNFDRWSKSDCADWICWLEKQGEQNKNYKTMIVKFICKKDWHGIGNYYYGKKYNGYPCEKEQKGYDIYDDNHVPTFCDEDFIDEYFNIVTEEKQGEQKPVFEIKTPEESLGIDSATYNEIVDECIYGEQKSTDKVKPKFHEGEWVVDKQGIVHQIANVVENVTNHTYGYNIVGGGYFNDNNESVRLWTIQDAKDGDVLMANAPFIFNGNLEGGRGCPGAHCGINTLGKFQIPEDKKHWTGHITTPATKEQRDTLMKAMADAEYTFDFEKKELKKIEKKSTDNEMKEALRTEYEKGRADAIAEMQKPVDCIDCTNSKGCINCEDGNMKETLVQKTAWSEEDECYMSECIGAIATKDGWSFEEKRKTKHWLKSLKDRVQPRRRHTIFDEII